MSGWDGATRLTAAVTLAVPVNPVQLVAHLEAFVTTKQQLHALKLCHRFGRGPSGSTRGAKRLNDGLKKFQELPLELIYLIDSFVLLPLRASLTEKYDAMFRCFGQTCSVRDHYSSEEIEEAEAEARDMLMRCDERFSELSDLGRENTPMWEEFEDAVEEQVLNILLEGDYFVSHSNYTEQWQTAIHTHRNSGQQVNVYGLDMYGFYSLERALKCAFGVDALIQTQTLPHHVWKLFHGSSLMEGTERYCTTLSYLHLPVNAAEHHASALNGSLEYDCTVGDVSACLGTVVDVDKLITLKSKIPQLQFALKQLGLSPFVHWSAAALQTSSAGPMGTNVDLTNFEQAKLLEMKTMQQQRDYKQSIEKVASEKMGLFQTTGPQLMLLAAGSSSCGHDF